MAEYSISSPVVSIAIILAVNAFDADSGSTGFMAAIRTNMAAILTDTDTTSVPIMARFR